MAEFVSVPVPVERVQEVYELLARQPAKVSPAREMNAGHGDTWTEALLDRMFVESSSAMRRILCAIAGKSPCWVSTGEIAAASGLTARQVIASLGPFEKRVRGRYRMSHWPFAAREFVDAGIFKYSMTPETASRMLDLMAQVDEQERDSR
jgi:hypothetical protein